MGIPAKLKGLSTGSRFIGGVEVQEWPQQVPQACTPLRYISGIPELGHTNHMQCDRASTHWHLPNSNIAKGTCWILTTCSDSCKASLCAHTCCFDCKSVPQLQARRTNKQGQDGSITPGAAQLDMGVHRMFFRSSRREVGIGVPFSL